MDTTKNIIPCWTIAVNDKVVDQGANILDLHQAYLNHLADHRTPDCSGNTTVAAYLGEMRVRVVGFDVHGLPTVDVGDDDLHALVDATFRAQKHKPMSHGTHTIRVNGTDVCGVNVWEARLAILDHHSRVRAPLTYELVERASGDVVGFMNTWRNDRFGAIAA
jgi:hypothetical protein